MQLSLLLCLIVGAISYQFYFVGAMENWGLITYRESYLLVDPENTSAVQKQLIALTVGHEIPHQWLAIWSQWYVHVFFVCCVKYILFFSSA
jgi:puromycin-sensitive aminopeptidase